MAKCPHCDSDISQWAKRLEQADRASTPKVWTCPDCDSVLGISDWGSSQWPRERIRRFRLRKRKRGRDGSGSEERERRPTVHRNGDSRR